MHSYPANFLTKKSQVDSAAFVASTASVVGDVRLGPDASVFYGAVLRADINYIEVGEGTNLQDNVVVHLADAHPAKIGARCTIGHGAIIHACRIEDECLIGMGAIVLDGAVVGEGSIIGAHSLVTMGTVIPPGSMAYGSPAKVVRPVSAVERESIRESARNYVQVAKQHADVVRQTEHASPKGK